MAVLPVTIALWGHVHLTNTQEKRDDFLQISALSGVSLVLSSSIEAVDFDLGPLQPETKQMSLFAGAVTLHITYDGLVPGTGGVFEGFRFTLHIPPELEGKIIILEG